MVSVVMYVGKGLRDDNQGFPVDSVEDLEASLGVTFTFEE